MIICDDSDGSNGYDAEEEEEEGEKEEEESNNNNDSTMQAYLSWFLYH